MKILLIDTCSTEGTIGLAEESVILASATLPARAASEHLIPAIRGLLAGGVRPGAIAVVNGPGSFTGVRAGLAAAKGLVEAWAIPLVAISRLAVLASALQSDGEVVALLDGGRGEYYCGVYRGRIRVSEELLRLEEVKMLLSTRPGLTSDQSVLDRLGENVQRIAEPGPEAILPLALDRIVAESWTDAALIDANYLRRTDAELSAKHP